MEKRLNKKEINNIRWKACDSLSGVLIRGQYKNYVLTMFFMKYVSDVWKDKKHSI